VVINKFNVLWTLRSPDKANPELIVHPDRVLPLAVAFEGLETVGRRSAQIVEYRGGAEICKLAARYLDQIGRKPFANFAVEGGFRKGVF
jgi:hypothetical protein